MNATPRALGLALTLALSACGAQLEAASPPAAIRAALAQVQPLVRACYERHLVANPAASGRIVLRFVVDAEGSVGSIAVSEADAPMAAMGPCARDALRGLTVALPAGSAPLTVSYPFTFHSDATRGS